MSISAPLLVHRTNEQPFHEVIGYKLLINNTRADYSINTGPPFRAFKAACNFLLDPAQL